MADNDCDIVADDFDKAQSMVTPLFRDDDPRFARDTTVDIEQLELCAGGGSVGPTLLQGAHLKLLPGRKYGVVGRNGCGKTTLLKHVARHAITGMRSHIRCLYIGDGSTLVESDTTVFDYLMDTHRERRQLLEQIRDQLCGDSDDADDVDVDRLEDVHHRLRLLGNDDAEARAARILVGLGFEDPKKQVRLRELSGGWRHRACLAAALFVHPDIILLDEPTSHLDLYAVCWLEQYLASLQQTTVVVVSHDHAFLDNVVDNVILFCEGNLHYYTGNYSAFESTRTKAMLHHKRAHLQQEARRRQLEDLAARGPVSVRGDHFTRSRKRTLVNRLGLGPLDGTKWKYGMMGPRPIVLAAPDEDAVSFLLESDVSDVPESTGDQGTLLVQLEDVAFSYPAPAEGGSPHPVLEEVNLKLTLDSRVVILGRNGSGKTTLLRLLSQELRPTKGSVTTLDGVRIGVFSQQSTGFIEHDDADLSPVSYLRARYNHASSQILKDALGRFGLVGVIAEEQPMSTLSAGQRARVILATIMLNDPHILLLDEVTSHLDAETNAALVFALQNFNGGLVIVSHEERLVVDLRGDVLVVDGGRLRPLGKGFDLYRIDVRKEVLKNLVAHPEEVVPRHSGPAQKRNKKKAPVVHSDPAGKELKPPNAGSGEATETRSLPSVTCRKCHGAHWTHSCPNLKQLNRKVMQPASAAATEAAEAEKQEVKSKKKIPTQYKDQSGSTWKVAVSKGTLRRAQGK